MANTESYIWYIYVVGVVVISASFFLAKMLIPHWLAKRRSRHEQFNEAAAKFCEAFTEARRLLDESRTFDVSVNADGKRVYDILKSDIDRHEKAMIDFKWYLSKRQRGRFEKAWNEYYSKNDWDCCLSDYHSKLDDRTGKADPECERELMKRALDRIEALLKFTKFR